MHSRCSTFAHSLSLILPGRRTLNLQTCIAAAGVAAGCARRATRAPLIYAGHRVGLACLADVMRLHGSKLTAFSLCGLLGFVSRPLATWSTACNSFRLSGVDSTKASLGSLNRIASLSSRPQLPAGHRRFSAQLIINLVDWRDFPQYLRHHCERFGLSTKATCRSFFLSLFGYRVGFRSPLLGASQPLYGLLLALALYESGAPSERF